MVNQESFRWRPRPLIAATTRVVAFALPIAASAGAAYGASLVVPPPLGSLSNYVLWWIGLSAAATAVLVVMGWVSRRLLPLATLMRLSLVFPDCAPSRFKVAMRTGTVETLQQRLATAREGWPDLATADAARRLLELVGMLDTHDRLTRGHSERVRGYAQAIGRELGLERRELDLLNWSALLHDVGKLEVPGRTLASRGRLDAAGWEILRRHPDAGDALIGPLRDWLGVWSTAVVQHHERWDGTGYPRGLAGSEISLAARIVAVADTFDVITSARSYKEAFTPSAAREEITRGAGTQFDPDVVRAFLAISVRRTRLTGALAWVAQLPVLGERVLVPAATTLSVAAVGLGVTPQRTPVREAAPAERAEQARPASRPQASTSERAFSRDRPHPTMLVRATARPTARARPKITASVGARRPSTRPRRPALPPPGRAPSRPPTTAPTPPPSPPATLPAIPPVSVPDVLPVALPPSPPVVPPEVSPPVVPPAASPQVTPPAILPPRLPPGIAPPETGLPAASPDVPSIAPPGLATAPGQPTPNGQPFG